MKTAFSGYYRPNDKEFKELWKDCTFTFDANALLNVYRYTHKTQEAFLTILDRLRDRVWLPHQAGYEYQENRLDVIFSQIRAYDQIGERLDATVLRLEKDLDEFRRHPFVDVDLIRKNQRQAVEKVKSELQTLKAKHPDLLGEDTLIS